MRIGDFVSKEDFFRYIKDNKSKIVSEKKSAIKYADAIDFVNVKAIEKSEFAIKENTPIDISDNGIITRNLVINTTNYLDSHLDVHIPNLWKKSISENPTTYLLKSHLRDFEYVITDSAIPYVKNMNWTDLGLNSEGKTQALIFKAEISRERNEFMYEQYLKGYVKQHSVGMKYINIFFCVNSDDRYFIEEKKNWDKYYNEIVNKEIADKEMCFWAVTEAKLIEGSAVLFGSNPITPTLSKNKSSYTQDEPLDTTKNRNSREITIEKEQLEKILKEQFKTLKK